MPSASVLFFLFAFSFNAGQLSASEEFHPAWWCRGAHAQTICGDLFRKAPELNLRRERFETQDGDFVDVDWLDAGVKSPKPVVLILHGFGGSSEAAYVRTLMKKVYESGWRAAALNARGATVPNLFPRINGAGETADLNSVIRNLIENRNEQEIYLVGFSVGGNRVLKWLGENGAGVPQVRKAVTVSAPIDLKKTAENLDQGFNKRVYTRMLLKGLKAQALEMESRFPGIIDREKTQAAETFAVYDSEVSARLNGFKSAEDYWAQSSSENYLDKIRTPVLMIHAVNDPFLTGDDLPRGKIELSSYLSLLLTSDGGHLGFITGNIPFRPDTWLEDAVLDFLHSS